MTTRQDPRIALMDFLKSIPPTLRTDEYLFIIMMCLGERQPQNIENFEAVVDEYLSQTGYVGLGAVVCTRAVIAMRMRNVLLKLETAEKLLKQLTASDPDFPPHLALGAPLKKKQYVQILERWRSLSSGALSDEAIAYFQENPQDLLPVTI